MGGGGKGRLGPTRVRPRPWVVMVAMVGQRTVVEV